MSRLVMVTKYLSHSHFCHFFSHSQRPNPSPSDLNPIFPGQKQANPSSHFTPSGPSIKSGFHSTALEINLGLERWDLLLKQNGHC